jgi:uncharacterized delta-60 repeat protein
LQPDGKVLAGGRFTQIGGQSRNRIARLTPFGDADLSFNPNANNYVYAIAVQGDGKIVVGGEFTNIAGQPRNRIARLNADGTLDNSFNPNANGAVRSIAVQADGRIIAVGDFSIVSGSSHGSAVRINQDGSLDALFNPTVIGAVALVLQSDGRILIGGSGLTRLNLDGSTDTSFGSNLSSIRAITLQPDGRILVGGDFGSAILRLNIDGTIDTTFNASLPSPTFVSAIAIQFDGRIIISGPFDHVGGESHLFVARLNVDGSVDSSFTLFGNISLVSAVQPDGKILLGGVFGFFKRINPGTSADSYNPTADNWVVSLTMQPDNKVLVGGFYSAIASQTRHRMARLNSDGTLDNSFNPDVTGSFYVDNQGREVFIGGVLSVTPQNNGQILIGGSFTRVAGVSRNGLARLDANGSLDMSFNPNPNLTVYSVVLQSDGRILICGEFTAIGGQTRNHVARLNTDGSLDLTFDPNANGFVNSVVALANGQVLIGGEFTMMGGQTLNHIGRLNADGTVDAGFAPEANDYVSTMTIEQDGKIIVGGNFTNIGGQTRNRLARLNSDGSLDNTFTADVNATVWTTALTANGNILIGGFFTSVGGLQRGHIARLNSDGSVQAAYNPDAEGDVYGFLIEPDGRVLVGGSFFSAGGQFRDRLARLNNDGSASESLDSSQSSVTWLRSGAIPDFTRVIFERSMDGGATYVLLGEGERVNQTSSWHLTGQNLSVGTYVRAHGFCGTGLYNGSGSIFELVSLIVDPPVGLTYSTNPAVYTKGSAITANTPSSSGGAVVSYSINPALPSGLNFNTTTGVITGTPTVVSGQTNYTVMAMNSGGSTTVQVTITINKASQTITVGTPAPANATYNTSFTIAATSNSGLAVAYSSSGICTNVGAVFTMTSGTGTCTVKYDQAGDANYNAAPQVTESVTAQKANQTITVNTHAPANATFNSQFTVAGTANSGLAVAYSSSGVCTNVGAVFTMTSGTGTCTVKYDQAGDTNYNAATQATESVTAQKANQTITVGTHAPTSGTFNSQFTVAATSSSGLVVAYSSSGVCTNVGAVFTMTSGTGTCTVKYDQAGDTNYNAGTQVTDSVTAQKANQTITFGALSNRTFGDSDFAVSATASSGLAVSFSATGNCTLSGGSTVHLTGAGSCTVTAAQGGDSNYNAANVPQSFNIAKAATTTAVTSSLNPSNPSQSVTFTAAVTSTAGTPTGTVQFKDNGTNMGSPVTLNGSGVARFSTSSLTAGTHSITADYSGDVNFATSAGTLSSGQTVNNQSLISFSQSSYIVSEDAHFLNITVNRAGNIATAVNVDYTTDDTNAPTNCTTLNSGLASSRCDFTPAFGTLKFAANETSKTFLVPITQDSHIEGPEMFNLHLSNLTGDAAFVAPSSATVTINDGTAMLPANAIDDATNFVRQHYHDFLNREPDQAGLDFWVSNFTQCNGDPQCLEVKRINVSAAFYLSIEFQDTGYLVERIYKVAYGDATGNSTFPSAHTFPVPIVRFNEFLADTQSIGLGVVVGQGNWQQQLENNKQAFTGGFAQRSRFTNIFGSMSNAQFVDTLNGNAGNPLSQSERDQLVTDLNNGSKTRAQGLRAVAEHPNLVTVEFNRAFVLMQFIGYLRRNPNDPQDKDHTGYDFWLTKLNQFNGNFQKAEMVKAFITSSEYRQRFGP